MYPFFKLFEGNMILNTKKRTWNITRKSAPLVKVNSTYMKRKSLTASTLLHRLVLSIELGTVQTGTGKVDPARKFKCTTAARDQIIDKKECRT